MIEVSTIFCDTVHMTRWLTPDEQRHWRAFLEAHRLVFARLERQLATDHDLVLGDYEILVRLTENPERRLRMSDLAEATLSSRSRLSHAIARLEGHGWVTREECPVDKRGTYAVLTDAGFEFLARAAPGHVDAVREALVDRLSADDFAALGRICAQLVEGLGSAAVAPSAGGSAG
jgi:DNA-binding MarR family transcriptional regulator